MLVIILNLVFVQNIKKCKRRIMAYTISQLLCQLQSKGVIIK